MSGDARSSRFEVDFACEVLLANSLAKRNHASQEWVVSGTLTVSFIQSGIVAAGLSGFYVQFFNELIIVLALLGHRWNQKRYRYGAAFKSPVSMK